MPTVVAKHSRYARQRVLPIACKKFNMTLAYPKSQPLFCNFLRRLANALPLLEHQLGSFAGKMTQMVSKGYCIGIREHQSTCLDLEIWYEDTRSSICSARAYT